jgi:uncharacterized OsmC-like protein
MESYPVTVGAGTLRPLAGAFEVGHEWTPSGVTVEGRFTGPHLLHIAVAGSVLNHVYREATARSIRIDGVRVRASGSFDEDAWRSTGVTYSVELVTDASEEQQQELLEAVDAIASVVQTLRAGTTVTRA